VAAVKTQTSQVRSRVLSEAILFKATLFAFVVWQIGGHIDLWYHAHLGFAIESFLTWPHALLYAGWLASAFPAAVYLYESRALAERSRALPAGYPLVLIGAAIFGLGGGVDLAWHTAFGFEVGHEALVSPAHLILIFSSGIGCLGLAWAAIDRLVRDADGGAMAQFGVALSLGIVLRVSLFAMLYSGPFSVDYASGGALAKTMFGFSGINGWSDMTAQVAGTTGMTLYAVLVSLFIVVPLWRLRLRSGFILTILAWTAAIGLVVVPETAIYVPALLAGALVGELIWAAMGRGSLGGRDGRVGYWAIAFAVPVTQLYAYFVLMASIGGGIAWSTSLWAGAPLLAGAYALLASGLAIPPAFAKGRQP
jgi:hypothetical protein